METIEVDEGIDVSLSDLDEALGYGARLVVHNDDHNSFDYVCECFCKYLKHTSEQALQCAMIIHSKGKYAVKQGHKEKLKPLREALVDAGLKATIEE